MSVDYKIKYIDIRAKFIEAVDVAYRQGYEEGLKEGQQAAQEQMMQQQQEQQMQQEAMMQGGQPGEEGMPPEAMGDEAMAQGAEAPADMPPEAMGGEEEGDELDQHISELQDLVAKGEKPSVLLMRKAVEGLADLRKNQKNSYYKKRRKSISAQKSFVDSIVKSFDEEKKSTTDNLEDIIKEHGLQIEE